MKMYLTSTGTYCATQDEAKKHTREFGGTFDGVDVPLKLRELVAYLNSMARPADAPVAVPVAPAPVPAGNGGPSYTEISVAIDDAWAGLPFARKFHFAALAMEEARDLVPLVQQVEKAGKADPSATADDLL